ncbi:MAG: polysaccharide pyruvyl transferase family protein [Pseudonocardiaceae bacterium]
MRRRPSGTAPRVGLFGLLGSGNFGNDGSLEAVLAFLRSEHPDAILGCLCAGPARVSARYGIPTTRLHWYRSEYQTASGAGAIALKTLGKGIDAIRTAVWVRRFDVVIVPGMGVLEATLPLRPWGFPYSLFLLCASGRLVGTKVALVNVGSNVIHQRLTRWLFTSAARLAHYRSYRDTFSKDAMRRMGVDTSGDDVYPDLAFALPAPPDVSVALKTVGVGVMAYYGGNDDRQRADEIHSSYVAKTKYFVRWLVDNGYRIRLLTGDHSDESVVREILSDLRAHRPDLEPSRVIAERSSSLEEVMLQMSAVDTVVATRYHNLVCALKLAKPTLSIGYAAKHDALMAGMGLADFCLSIHSLDVERQIKQFAALENQREELKRTMVERNMVNVQRLAHQYRVLSATLFPGTESAHVPAGTRVRP